MPAPRCGYCGWYTSRAGLHDPRYVGHGTYCPSSLYTGLRTAGDIADQWHLIEEWSRLALSLGLPGAEDMWRHMSWALMQRADQLGVAFPVADDASELAESR